MVKTTNTEASFKIDDVFSHSKFTQLFEFEIFARERFADLEYKIQHVDIHTLDTSSFVKSHEFDQTFCKV